MQTQSAFLDKQIKFEGLRVGLLGRVSSQEQMLKGLSIHAQEERLRQYAEQHKMIVVDKYFDEGITGSSWKRKERKRMFRDIKKGKIDIFIFTRLDRYTRSPAHYYKMKETLDAHGVEWVCTDEQYDTITSQGQFQVHMQLGFAAMELSKISERVSATNVYKFNHKEPLNKSHVLGLKIENKKYVIDEEKVDFARYIFNKYEELQSLYSLVRFLKDNHNYKTSHRTLKRMLSHRIYIGEYHHPTLGIGYDYAPQIISYEQFNRVQTLLNANIKRFAHGKGDDKPLRGVVKCAHCGNKMIGMKIKRKCGEVISYYCKLRHQHHMIQKDKCTNKANVLEHNLEAYFIENVESAIDKLAFELEHKEANEPKVDKSKLEQKLKNLKIMFQEADISEGEYRTKTNLIKQQLEMPLVTEQRLSLDAIKQSLPTNFKDMYHTLSPLERRRLILSVIKEIKVHSNQDFELIFF